MARLAPVSEEPVIDEDSKNRRRRGRSIHSWLKSHMIPAIRFNKNPDLKILLSVLGCPLSPVAVVPKQPRDVASSAQYIIQQFWATSGCSKIEGTAKSMYATGKVRMEMTREHGLHPAAAAASKGSSGGVPHTGCFVMWQLVPDMWLFELAVSGYKIGAGSDGKVAWRRTPWLGAHAARGIVRPLRRTLQGLDPLTIGAVFSRAQHVGEKHMDDEEECFVLELAVDSATLSSWSDSSAEIIKHRMLGFFSQRSGLLVRLDDCQLTRMHSPGAEAMYWETATSSFIGDYRPVDGVMIAHSGRSTVSMLRFGIGAPVVKQMEESWTIEDVQFNVQGLSDATFIPPEDVQRSCLYEL